MNTPNELFKHEGVTVTDQQVRSMKVTVPLGDIKSVEVRSQWFGLSRFAVIPVVIMFGGGCAYLSHLSFNSGMWMIFKILLGGFLAIYAAAFVIYGLYVFWVGYSCVYVFTSQRKIKVADGIKTEMQKIKEGIDDALIEVPKRSSEP